MSKTIRTNLVTLRATRGRLSQRQVAEATGIGQKTLSALETGATKGVEFNTLLKLVEFFKCTFDDLLVIEEEDSSPPSEQALLRANDLIATGLKQAMEAPPASTQEIWAQFDSMRERMQLQAQSSANKRGKASERV